MTCVLCPNPSKGVGEHVWPRWLIQEFHGEGPFTTEKGGIAYTKRDGVTPVTAIALPGVHVPMCESCNTELNRSIEEPAKPVIRRLLPWSSTHAWPAISTNEAAALARWFLKIGLLAGHPEAVHDNPHVQRDEDFPRFERVEPAWLDWMRTGSAPPADFSVYVAKRSVMGEQPWEGETQRIFLPTRVVVGDRELRFATRSFGVRGLDVTMVLHPGWPILHPLERPDEWQRFGRTLPPSTSTNCPRCIPGSSASPSDSAPAGCPRPDSRRSHGSRSASPPTSSPSSSAIRPNGHGSEGDHCYLQLVRLRRADTTDDIDADFEISVIHGSHTFSLTIESSGGATGSGNVRNPEYPLLLEEALRRLGSLDVELIDAFVDSRRVAQLSTAERRIHVDGQPFPIRLTGVEDFGLLRRGLTRPQGDIGSARSVGGGNQRNEQRSPSGPRLPRRDRSS